MRLFAFGLGYCARAAIARRPGRRGERDGALGGGRRGAAARGDRGLRLRRRALRSRAARGARARGHSAGLGGAGACGRSGARPFRPGDRGGAGVEAHPLSLDHRRLRRLGRGVDRRDKRDARRPRRAGAGGSRPRRPGKTSGRRAAFPSISCASPAFTGRGAMRWSSCGRATRGGSSSRARCSTASMSTTSRQVDLAAGRRRAGRAGSGTSPTRSRRRRRTSSPMPQIFWELSRRRRSRLRAQGYRRWPPVSTRTTSEFASTSSSASLATSRSTRPTARASGRSPRRGRGGRKARGSKLFWQVSPNKKLFSPNFSKHFFGGFERFQ